VDHFTGKQVIVNSSHHTSLTSPFAVQKVQKLNFQGA
jgi:hypothetical protein